MPHLSSQQVELLDVPRLKTQLVGVERRVASGGRDAISHPAGGHDDLANCLAGVVSLTAKPRREWRWLGGDDRPREGESADAFLDRTDREEAELKEQSQREILERVRKTGVWFPSDPW